METYTIVLMAAASAIFLLSAVYLHMLRKKAQSILPAPFVTPHGKRGPRKKRS